MPKSKDNQSPSKQPFLLVTYNEAQKQINERIVKGRELLSKSIGSSEELERHRADYYKWDQYNEQLLKNIFDDTSIADRYKNYLGAVSLNRVPLNVEISRVKDSIQLKIDRLDSIKERLPLFKEAKQNNVSITSRNFNKKKVFIVHGHDETLKQTVARIIEQLDLEAIILHERASSGMTVIEKLESNSDVGFAIILLTPDDEGKAKTDSSYRDRARQNVIAELGYFVGKLGREKMCPLYVEGVEVPSDFAGVVYVPIDNAGAWKFSLAKELLAAGFDIDVKKIL
jgi:predicted nucleotide-binding protein